MVCAHCKAELPANARFCPACGQPVPGGTSIEVNMDIGTNKGEVVGAIPGEGATPPGLAASATQKFEIETVEAGGAAVGAILGGEGSQIHVGGQQHYGDVVRGDKVRGDKITAGDISGSAVAIGRGGQPTVTQGVTGEDLARLFAAVYRHIEARPADPDVDKTELTETVQKIEEEAKKGEAANPTKVERWLKFLAAMAPDIWDVTVASLANPVAGIATALRKVVDKAKAEAKPD